MRSDSISYEWQEGSRAPSIVAAWTTILSIHVWKEVLRKSILEPSESQKEGIHNGGSVEAKQKKPFIGVKQANIDNK